MSNPSENRPRRRKSSQPSPHPQAPFDQATLSTSDVSVLDLLDPIPQRSRKEVRARETTVAVIMGSLSDLNVMASALKILDQFDVAYHKEVISAHRTPKRVLEFAENARKQGFKVIIAGAGGAAHLPGMVAAHTTLPVIGVPVPTRNLGGMDSLYSIVQMPAGVPVATVSIGGGENAALLALQILSTSDQRLADMLQTFKGKLIDRVEVMNSELENQLTEEQG